MDNKDIIYKYLYYKSEQLNNEVNILCSRHYKRSLDSVELLEEIIAKERLNLMRELEKDIIHLLK